MLPERRTAPLLLADWMVDWVRANGMTDDELDAWARAHDFDGWTSPRREAMRHAARKRPEPHQLGACLGVPGIDRPEPTLRDALEWANRK